MRCFHFGEVASASAANWQSTARLAQLAALLLAVGAFGERDAVAQAYPAKPVRLITPSSPGSGVDIVARFVGQKLSEAIGQQFIVDNRAGAGANLGAEIAAKAGPDGYTLFLGTPAHAINPSLYRRLAYDIVRDFAPVTQLTSGYYVLVVNPALLAKNVKELIALAKAKPGQLNFASAGTGNATHLAGELFKSLTQVNLVHVPYKGSGPALTDVIGGQVQSMFSNLTAAIPHIKSGKLRALAVTGERRAQGAPDIPTMIESGVKGYSVTSWYGLLAPVHTPQAIIDRLNVEVVKVMRVPDMKERLSGEGAEPSTSTPAEFADFIKSEIVKWAKVIKSAGLAGTE